MKELEMKRFILTALVIITAMVTTGRAQEPSAVHRATLMYAFDLDGEAADADQIVTAANGDLLDANTFTITAQPDSCRLVDMTVTDANSSLSAGVLTVVGTDCLGAPLTATFTFAGGGSGVKTLTVSSGYGTGAYFSTISSVTTGTLTGEGGAGTDLMTLGYTSNSVNGWALYGKVKPVGPNGERGVDVNGYFTIGKAITTSGVSSTTVTGVSGADDAFALVSVGDLLTIQTGGVSYERKVTAKGSADSITVNVAITIPAAGVGYTFKKAYFSTDPHDDMSFSVYGYKTLALNWEVDANANTGGVVTAFECSYAGPESPSGPWVVLDATTIASGDTQLPTSESVDLGALPFNRCRFGLSFGTGDDADAAAENISASIILSK